MKNINTFEEFVNENNSINEAATYTVEDVLAAWKDAFGEDMKDSDRADVPEDIKADYRGKVTIEDLQEIYDDRYGDELEVEFLKSLEGK